MIVDVNASTSGALSSVDMCLGTGATILHFATKANRLDIVKLLLEGLDFRQSKIIPQPKNQYMTEANINVAESRGQTPLIVACQDASKAIVHYLIDHGAKISAVDRNGCNILHFACSHGWVDVLQRLFKDTDETSIDRLLSALNNEGLTPFEVAASSNKPNIIRYLLTEKAQCILFDRTGPRY